MDRLWLSISEVCFLFSISRPQLGRWTNDKEYAHLGFPKSFFRGRRVFYKASEIYEYGKNTQSMK